MKYVQHKHLTTVIIKNSKFISVLIPYSTFSKEIISLKNEHPKAAHFVYAYRYLNESDQIVENQSDDGEPKGSSGRPTLSVLRGHELINTAIIIVRYFGGTKLGVGGLVKAYSDSSNQVINQARLEEYIKQHTLHLILNISNLAQTEHILKKYKAKIKTKDFSSGTSIDMEIEVPFESKDLLIKVLENIARIRER